MGEETETEEIDEEVDAEEARLLSGRNKVRVLDVRSQEDVAEGTIPGAMWSDEERLVEIAKYVRRGEDVPILVVCSNGSKSEKLAEKLRSEDIPASYLKGGFKSWEGKGYPQDPREDAEYDGPDITMPGTGTSMGGDDSAEASKIETSKEYYDGQEEATGTNPLDARAETVVDQRDLEASKKFERDESYQREGLLDNDEEEGKDLDGGGGSEDSENAPEAAGSDDVDASEDDSDSGDDS